MFESLKRLFSRPATPPPPEPPDKSVTISPAEPAAYRSRGAPTYAPATGPQPVPLQTGDVVHLPLNDILAQLPATVAPLLLARPGGTFSLPVRSAVEQLGTGAVRIRFAVLRQSALPGTFANDSSQDETLIDLPLPQVLAAVGTAALARRANQKRTVVPDEVTGVFGPKISTAPRTDSSAATSIPTSAPLAAPAAAAPAPAPPITPVAPIKPVSPAPVPKPAAVAPLPSFAAKAASPLPFATRPAPAPPPKTETAKPAAPVGDDGTLATTIGAISHSWPDAVRQEIAQFNLGGASVLIPMSRVETGMKAGRVVFAWSELIGWIDGSPAAISAQGATELELPLMVIAPLFFGKHRASAPQKRVSLGENIPDLFAGLAKPAAAAVAPEPAVVAPVAVTAVPAVAAAPAVPAEPNPLGELFGQPFKWEWSPQEIAQEIAALPGVSGSLLATEDGLLIAGHVPPPLMGETLAAFLPQIFGRMSSYAEEVKLGPLRTVTVSTDSSVCAVFSAGKIHLAVLGKAGQSLPEPMLLRIAAALAKPNP